MAKAKPNPIVCGRRICNGPCGRWRPIIDFIHKADRRADQGRWIAGICGACHRAYGKKWYKKNTDQHKARVKQWKRDHPDLVATYRATEAENRKRPHVRERERERFRARYYDPITGPRMREYYRVYRNMKRHEQRVLEGREVFDRNGKVTAGFVPIKERLDPAPFAAWIERKVLEYGDDGAVADRCNISRRLIGRLRAGDSEFVSFLTVDLALTEEGSTGIWQLYPELFHEGGDDLAVAV